MLRESAHEPDNVLEATSCEWSYKMLHASLPQPHTEHGHLLLSRPPPSEISQLRTGRYTGKQRPLEGAASNFYLIIIKMALIFTHKLRASRNKAHLFFT